LVRTWVTMLSNFSPRLKSMTMWGFVTSGEEDIMMVTPELQPRPQYVAHAVMANVLRGARFAKNYSTDEISLFRWENANGPVLVAWAKNGEREVTLKVPSMRLAITDIMGNTVRSELTQDEFKLKLGPSPSLFLRR